MWYTKSKWLKCFKFLKLEIFYIFIYIFSISLNRSLSSNNFLLDKTDSSWEKNNLEFQNLIAKNLLICFESTTFSFLLNLFFLSTILKILFHWIYRGKRVIRVIFILLLLSKYNSYILNRKIFQAFITFQNSLRKNLQHNTCDKITNSTCNISLDTFTL